MEDVLKEALPKEVIEVQEALPLPEPETGGIGWGQGIGIVVAVAVVAYLAKRVRCCKK
jgi:hypothetical protein